MGRDSTALAFWLYEQCELLDITFRFNYAATGVQLSSDCAIEAIQLLNVKRPGQLPQKLTCSNLVVAAGPYSSWILRDLFKQQRLALENHVQRAQWFQATTQGLTKADEVILRVSTQPTKDGKIESDISILAQSEEQSLSVFGMSSSIKDQDLSHADARHDSEPRLTELRAVASAYLNNDNGLVVTEKASIIERGCADLSVANNGNPIIDKVPASALGRAPTEEQDANPSGVWLCYGFGRHGTMLAPGTARMLVQKMVKGSCEADCFDFSIPVYTKIKPEDKGKGKTKAKA